VQTGADKDPGDPGAGRISRMDEEHIIGRLTTTNAVVEPNATEVSCGAWAPWHIPARQPPSASPGSLDRAPGNIGVVSRSGRTFGICLVAGRMDMAVGLAAQWLDETCDKVRG